MAVLAWVAVVVVIAIGGFLPTNDGPCHLFAGWVRANFADPHLRYFDFFWLHDPPTARGFIDIFIAAFALIPNEETAYFITVSICVTTWCVGGLLTASALASRVSITHLLIVACSLQTSFYMGFFPFILGGGLAFVGLGLWLRLQDRLWLATLLAAFCFFLSARCHIFAAGLVGLLLAADALSRGLRATLAGTVVGLPLCLVVFQMLDHLRSSKSDVLYTEGWERLTQFPDAFIPGPWWKTWPPLLLVVVGFAQGRGSARRGVLFVGFLLLIAAVVLPRDFLGWQFAGWRFLPIAAVVGWAFVRVPASKVGQVVLLAVGVSQLAWSAWFHLDQQEKNAPLLAALKKLTPHPMFRFPIVRVRPDDIVYGMNPRLHLGQLVTMRTGGTIFYGHHLSAAYHALLLKDGPVLPDTKDMNPTHFIGQPGDASMSLMMTRAARFDGITYYGYPDEADYLRKIGYDVVFQEGGLIVADLIGCPLTINMKNVTSPVTVAIGFENGNTPINEFTLNPGVETSYSHTIDRIPCGRRWLIAAGPRQECSKIIAEGASLDCTLKERAPPPAAP
ncbi:MAG: hypothetical protein Q8O67_18145 [Deltaproteobacteria bacterium]|nr:hypothetical protein [Deltaproteobacteria bacterium]